MVPNPPFVAITSFGRRSHWLSCYAHGGFSVSVDVEEWRGGPHGDKKEATDASLTEGAVASLIVISKQLGRCVSIDAL